MVTESGSATFNPNDISLRPHGPKLSGLISHNTTPEVPPEEATPLPQDPHDEYVPSGAPASATAAPSGSPAPLSDLRAQALEMLRQMREAIENNADLSPKKIKKLLKIIDPAIEQLEALEGTAEKINVQSQEIVDQANQKIRELSPQVQQARKQIKQWNKKLAQGNLPPEFSAKLVAIRDQLRYYVADLLEGDIEAAQAHLTRAQQLQGELEQLSEQDSFCNALLLLDDRKKVLKQFKGSEYQVVLEDLFDRLQDAADCMDYEAVGQLMGEIDQQVKAAAQARILSAGSVLLSRQDGLIDLVAQNGGTQAEIDALLQLFSQLEEPLTYKDYEAVQNKIKDIELALQPFVDHARAAALLNPIESLIAAVQNLIHQRDGSGLGDPGVADMVAGTTVTSSVDASGNPVVTISPDYSVGLTGVPVLDYVLGQDPEIDPQSLEDLLFILEQVKASLEQGVIPSEIDDPQSFEAFCRQILTSPSVIKAAELVQKVKNAYQTALMLSSIVVSGSVAGMAAMGVRALLGGFAVSNVGKIGVWLAAMTAEAATFSLVQRGMSCVLFGQSFYQDFGDFATDFWINFAMFGVLKGGSALYAKTIKLIDPQFALNFPKWYQLGEFGAEYAVFNLWSVVEQIGAFYLGVAPEDVTLEQILSIENCEEILLNNAKMLIGLKIAGFIMRPLSSTLMGSITQAQRTTLAKNADRMADLVDRLQKGEITIEQFRERQIKLLEKRLSILQGLQATGSEVSSEITALEKALGELRGIEENVEGLLAGQPAAEESAPVEVTVVQAGEGAPESATAEDTAAVEVAPVSDYSVEQSPDGRLFKFRIELENGEEVLIDAGMLTDGGNIAFMGGYETYDQLVERYVGLYGEEVGVKIAQKIVTIREALSMNGVMSAFEAVQNTPEYSELINLLSERGISLLIAAGGIQIDAQKLASIINTIKDLPAGRRALFVTGSNIYSFSLAEGESIQTMDGPSGKTYRLVQGDGQSADQILLEFKFGDHGYEVISEAGTTALAQFTLATGKSKKVVASSGLILSVERMGDNYYIGLNDNGRLSLKPFRPGEMGYVFGVFIRVTLEGEVIIREVPRHPEIVELKSPQPASAPLQEPPIQADPVDIGINDNVNAQNYGELENIEVLQNGDILPGHDFVLGDPETYGRELLVVNTGPDSPIRPVLDQAKIMGDAMKQSGCSTLEIAEAIARMVNEEFAKGQGHNIGNAGEAMTIGVFMEGGGCCRHRAALLQLALQEAGIKSHYVRGEASIGGGESGMHAWVEIDAKGDSSFSYVIDPNLHVSGWVKPQINNNGMKTYKLGKFGIFSYSVDPAQHNVVWRPNNAEVQQASSAQGVWFEDGYQVHDDLAEIEIPTGNALYFRFAIEGAETWEIVRLNNGRYFLRNQQGELREITKDSPVLFKDSNSQTVLILAINDGKLNIQDSSTNGILYEKNFHPLAEGILESVAPAVPPLTVEMLSETVPDINYINDVIIPAQVGEIAPGIERPAAAEGTPGALVEISNREVVVISDLHESLTNLDLFLSKYSEQISQGKILVFDGDALHDGFDMADSIKMMKAILNLYAMHPESVIYVQGNHDHAWGKELGKINNKGIIPVGELFKMELLKQLGQEYAISLENFFNNCPLAVIVKNQGVTAIIGHALVPSAENLANLPVAFNRDTLINARSYDDLAFAMTWNRPQGYDHKRLFTQADVKKMLELLGLPEDTLVVLGHTTNGNKDSAYVPNGFENVVILMSKYDSSLSVVEINLDQAEVMDLNGQSPIGGMVFSTSAQPSAAAAGQ